MKIINTILLSITIFCSSNINSQYYSSGSDPASIKWQQINTTNFQIIFPEEEGCMANKMAAIFEEVYKYGGESLAHTPRKISVVIHSKSANSNGFVSWAPRRIELYPSPNQDMVSQEWLEHLAIHEFRHVVQIDKLHTGFTRILDYIFGEQATGAILGAYLPMWLLEGDATVTETALSESGRGRLPSFEQELRAQMLEKKIYSYEKAYLGSYKDFVPNYYKMGYFFVAGVREKYGAKVWENAIENSGRNSWSLFPFTKSIKKNTGLYKKPLYRSIFAYLDSAWQEQDKKIIPTGFNSISPKSRNYKNYTYPTPINDSVVIAELNGPGELTRFVSIDNKGKEKTVFIPGNRNKEPFSYNNKMLVWAEEKQDLRRENRSYSIIKSYNLTTKKLSTLSKRSRYFSPALNAEGNRIVAVKVTTDNQYSLEIIDAQTGQIISNLPSPDNQFIYTPSWDEKGKHIVTIQLTPMGKSICITDPKTQKWTTIVPSSHTEIRLPKLINDTIFFTGSYSGVENIYMVSNADKEIKQLTNAKFGAMGGTKSRTQPDKLIYSNYSSQGYSVVEANLSQLPMQPFSAITNNSVALYKSLQKDEKGKPDFNRADTTYNVKKYSKWNLFSPHSWSPLHTPNPDGNTSPGISLLSQNLLGTSFTTLGINTDPNRQREKYYLNYLYNGCFPTFEIKASIGDENFNTGYINNDYDSIIIKDNISFSQLNIGMGLPFNLSRGKYHRLIKPSVKLDIDHRSKYSYQTIPGRLVGKTIFFHPGSIESHTAPSNTTCSMEYSLLSYNIRKRTPKDVSPRWGQIIQGTYKHTTLGDNNKGAIGAILSTAYIPSPFKHHAFKVQNNWQWKTDGELIAQANDTYLPWRYSDVVSMPRGFESNSVANDQLYSFKGDYIFPLCYPDLTLTNAFYLKRIQTNLFIDYSWTKNTIPQSTSKIATTNRFSTFSSTGFEAWAEVHLFHIIIPVNIGYRYSYTMSTPGHYQEFLFSLNLSGYSVNKNR